MISPLVSRILQKLAEDSRIPMEHLGAKVGSTRHTTGRIVRRLQEKGIIRAYAPLLNPATHQTYFIEFKTNPREPDIITSLAQLPNIYSLDGIIGDFSLFAKICATNQVEFSRTLEQIDKFMVHSHFQQYRVINTIQCFKEGGEIVPTEIPVAISTEDEVLLQRIRLLPAKINVSILAAELATTQPTLSKKLAKFLNAGIVQKYSICVAPAFLHLEAKFILRIKPLSLDRYNAIAWKISQDFREVMALYRTGEDFGLLAIVRTPDISAYNSFLRQLYATVEVEDTRTVLVIEEQIPEILPIYSTS